MAAVESTKRKGRGFQQDHRIPFSLDRFDNVAFESIEGSMGLAQRCSLN
jgi:hypothetical protein